MHSRQEDSVEVAMAQPSISAAQTGSALQCIAALSGTRQIMQAANTVTQHAGGIPVSEARPLDRLRARKFQMNSSTLLFTPANGSCRQDKHASSLFVLFQVMVAMQILLSISGSHRDKKFNALRLRSWFKPVSCKHCCW